MMIRRGTTQEEKGPSTDTRTDGVNLPQHHNLSRQSAKPINGDGHLGMSFYGHSASRKLSRLLRCARPLYLFMMPALLTSLLLSVSNVFNPLSFPMEESMQRQFPYGFITVSVSRRYSRNDKSFRQPRVLHIDPQSYTVHSAIYEDHKELLAREVHVPTRERRARHKLTDSRLYKSRQRDPLREGECQPMQPWQETSFPSCNKIHEVHMQEAFEVLTEGGYNTVFKMNDNGGSTHIVKILRYYKDYSDRNLDRVRRDSLIMERATASNYVVNTYSYCGFSQIIEHGKGGDLHTWIKKAYDRLSQSQKLQIATQVAQALADVHDLDGTGISSMTHGDLASKQFILVDCRFKLSDFNKGRFLRWNATNLSPCPYTIGLNDGKFRSPEEYQYVPQTAAIDVWALGSIFVQLVTGRQVWDNYDRNDAQKAIAKGELPPFREHILQPSDPINQVLLQAVDMCYTYEPNDRPKPRIVAAYLQRESKRLGVEWDQPFVVPVTMKESV